MSKVHFADSARHTRIADDFFDSKVNSSKHYSFSDETKRIHSCIISNITYSLSGKYNCFWDKHPISGNIFGCPIELIPNKGIAKMNSATSGVFFSVQQNLSCNQFNNFGDVDERIHDVELYSEKYFCLGSFCSPECILAWINDNENNPKYQYSKSLLYRMMRQISNLTSDIIPAPHWLLLDCYGGDLNIEKFRSLLGHVEFISHGLIFDSLGEIFEEIVSFKN